MDVNIPEYITDDEDPTARIETDSENGMKQSQFLAAYLWENYLEPNEHENIFFMGIGSAFHGLVRLLTDKGVSSNIP